MNIQRIDIKNDYLRDMVIIIEPWANEVRIASGSVLELHIKHRLEGHPYVTFGDEFVTVYLWSSCTCKVVLDNQEVEMPGLLVPHP